MSRHGGISTATRSHSLTDTSNIGNGGVRCQHQIPLQPILRRFKTSRACNKRRQIQIDLWIIKNLIT
jgi:hypothetical protein